MSYRNIHQAIVDKLTADADKLAEVNYAMAQFESYPSAVVQNSNNRNDYNSTGASRERIYAFSVFVYYLIQNSSEMENGVKAVEDALDQILNIFTPDSLSPTVDITSPAPSSVITSDAGDEGVYIIGEVVIETKVYTGCSA